jgi:glutamyl-tRNA synthetase
MKVVAEAAGLGMGKVAQPVRVAVTGNTVSPGIGETLELVGRDEALRRLSAALST